MSLRSQVTGCGAYLPDRVITNSELAVRLDTSDEWIRKRTGIGERRVAAPGELTSDLAYYAAQRALASAGMSGSDLDLLVLATATPDNTFPATAAKVQARLGMVRGAAFDVQAVCAGFIFALSVADNALRLGQARTAVVIGAETFSRILDWDDRGTCVLFGDGAGALVLKA
ncbi:MAG: 3-oxoacyl-ACP synthase, partial [Alphaproteobacteria bacterium]|nr:3-oxoacyl-ACP synthase [Alphaproteobacteria bacterium]